jgi:hypothetical protein
MGEPMNKLIWKFDILVYKLFRWRWNDRFKNNSELRKLFLRYLTAWEVIEREPAMGIGDNPEKMPKMEDECK